MRGNCKACLLLIFSLILGNYNGRIALWDRKTQSRTVFSRPVAALPPADQAALDRGIPIDSREQLIQLLEDYLS